MIETMKKEAAVEFLAELFGGEHHIPGKVKPFGPGWCVSMNGDLSTFDFDGLTRLVFLAHDRCVRAAVMHSGPRMIKIVLHPRTNRDGHMYERHPTLCDAISTWRERYKEPTS